MKYIFYICLLTVSVIYPQDLKLTLKESIEMGIQNSEDIRISRSKLKITDAKVSEVNSMFLPQLKFLANYTRLSDNVPPFEVTTPFSPQAIRISEPVLNNYYLKLSLQQPLFTGFRLLSTKKASEYSRDAAVSELSVDMNKIALDIHVSFWNLYKAKEMRDLVEQSLKQIGSHLEVTGNFLEIGLVTKNDYLKLQVQYSNTKLQLIEAENNLDVARAVFNKTLGLPMDSQTDIITDELISEIALVDLGTLIQEAKSSRQELETLTLKLKSAQQNVTAVGAGWLPNIYLTSNYYYSNPNNRFQPLKEQWNDTWDVGVTLSWDIWDWGMTSSKTVQAEEITVQAEANFKKISDFIEIEVYKSYLNLIKLKEKVEVARIALEQASENYRITSEKYNEQLATSTDLIDAEVSELQAETNLKTTLIEFNIARIQLDKAVGRKIY